MQLNPDSLERLVPEQLSRDDTTGQEALRIGLERYAFASRHCRPGRLLDIACGVGYGTSLLTERVPQIDSALGIDLSEGAIAYARDHYADPRTRFLASDAMAFTDPTTLDAAELRVVFLVAVCLNYAVRLSQAGVQIKNLAQEIALLRTRMDSLDDG